MNKGTENMVRNCFDPDCDCNHSTRNSTCKFTEFPQNPQRKTKWIRVIAQEDRVPNKSSVICTCPNGIRGVNARKTPMAFRRNGSDDHLFSQHGKRKRLLEFTDTINESVGVDESVSYSSGLLFAHKTCSESRALDDVSSQDLEVSQLNDSTEEGTTPDGTLSDSSSTSIPVHTSTSNISAQHVSQAVQVYADQLAPHSRNAFSVLSDNTVSPTAQRTESWSPAAVECNGAQVHAKECGIDLQAPCDCQAAATQVALGGGGVETMERDTQTISVSHGIGSQTSPIVFCNQDNFTCFGDNLAVVKSLINEIIEWRDKLAAAEQKVVKFQKQCTSLHDQLQTARKHHEQEIKVLQEKNDVLQEKYENGAKEYLKKIMEASGLKKMLESEQKRLLYDNICITNFKIAHFTGLANADVFNWLCSMFTMPLKYYKGWEVTTMSRENQLFMTLMKLRRNFDFMDLATWFNVSQSRVANVVWTWIDALHKMNFETDVQKVPSRAKNQTWLSECFTVLEDYHMFISCTGVQACIPMPKDVSYKHKTTLKGLVGIAPNGALAYVSKLFPGSTPDKQVFTESDLVKSLKPGDIILADKGLLIREVLPKDVNLSEPTVMETPQLTADQVARTRKNAFARILLDRSIQRIKEYEILNLIPVDMYNISSKVFQVCAALINLKIPLEEIVMEQHFDVEELASSLDYVLWQPA